MTELEAIHLIHQGLAVAAPGSDGSTLAALGRIGPVRAAPRVLDLGCGPGRSTLALAAALGPGARVVGVDRHAPFLRALERTAEAQGLAAAVETRCQSIDQLDDRPGSVDLIWSEGAAYTIGFARALSLWRPLLAPGGRAAVTELCWCTERPPAEAAAFWRAGYPDMVDLAGTVARARGAGYELVATFMLPPAAWWAYYGPLRARLAALAPAAAKDAALGEVLVATEREVALYEQHGDAYGYAFLLLR